MVFSLDNLLYCMLWAITGIALNCFTTPIFALSTIPAFVGFYLVQRFYIASSRYVQRQHTADCVCVCVAPKEPFVYCSSKLTFWYLYCRGFVRKAWLRASSADVCFVQEVICNWCCISTAVSFGKCANTAILLAWDAWSLSAVNLLNTPFFALHGNSTSTRVLTIFCVVFLALCFLAVLEEN